MRTLIERYALPRMLALLFSALLAFQPAAFGQDYAKPAFTQQELDQMLAPIALYPDSLLSQILMASTYPLEIVQAARWSRSNPGLHGDHAVRAVADQDWDPSVKSLVAFPQILSMMDQNLEWTERLGEAFLAQEPHVMDTVQGLRQRAYAAGNLRSNDRIRVDSQGRVIVVEPASPQVVYVPYYDPRVVYGPWWWPAYPPVYWAPWSGYYVAPGYAGFGWGSGIGISVGFFFGNFDWHQRHARVVHVNNYYYRRTVIVNREINVPNATVTRNVNVAPGRWQHDPAHRRSAPYRVEAVRERFTPAGTAADARRNIRGQEPVLAPAPAARSRQEIRTEMRGAETQTRTRENAAPAAPPSQPTVARPREAPAAQPSQPTIERRRDAPAAPSSPPTVERRRDAPAAPSSPPTVERRRDAPAAPSSPPTVERRRDSFVAPPSQPTVERRRDAPVALPSQPTVERQPRALAAPPSQPTVERRREAPVALPSQPTIERQPHAPAPLPRINAPVPQTSANAPAQRSSGNHRGSSDSARSGGDGDRRQERR